MQVTSPQPPRSSTLRFLLSMLREEVDLAVEARDRLLELIEGIVPVVEDVAVAWSLVERSPVGATTALLNGISMFSRRHGPAVRAWMDRLEQRRAGDSS